MTNNWQTIPLFSTTLYEQFAEADRLEAVIKRNLEVLGYGE